MLKSSSWVGFIELGNPFKCGPMDWEGGRKHRDKQPKVCPGLQERILNPSLSLMKKLRALEKDIFSGCKGIRQT